MKFKLYIKKKIYKLKRPNQLIKFKKKIIIDYLLIIMKKSQNSKQKNYLMVEYPKMQNFIL